LASVPREKKSPWLSSDIRGNQGDQLLGLPLASLPDMPFALSGLPCA
jgi:hypothetical protein